MQTSEVTTELGALAQETRLSVYRLLVQQGLVALPPAKVPQDCASLLAEATFNHLAPDDWRAMSAGRQPTGQVHPRSLAPARAGTRREQRGELPAPFGKRLSYL